MPVQRRMRVDGVQVMLGLLSSQPFHWLLLPQSLGEVSGGWMRQLGMGLLSTLF